MRFDVELVGKIGSMALIRIPEYDLNYNVISNIGRELTPGMMWISSGAVEIGRLDYIRRTGKELKGEKSDIMTDYAAQGQAILMAEYRRYIPSQYSVRQLLVEHTHFNDPEKRMHIHSFLMRNAAQNAIPIINHNDVVSFEANRCWEIQQLRKRGQQNVVECIDNDETASTICMLVRARNLLILTSTDGIYSDPNNPQTLIKHVEGKDPDELIAAIDELQNHCHGASREGAGGARSKLEFIKDPVRQGTTVFIANAKYGIRAVLENRCPHTIFRVR